MLRDLYVNPDDKYLASTRQGGQQVSLTLSKASSELLGLIRVYATSRHIPAADAIRVAIRFLGERIQRDMEAKEARAQSLEEREIETDLEFKRTGKMDAMDQAHRGLQWPWTKRLTPDVVATLSTVDQATYAAWEAARFPVVAEDTQVIEDDPGL